VLNLTLTYPLRKYTRCTDSSRFNNCTSDTDFQPDIILNVGEGRYEENIGVVRPIYNFANSIVIKGAGRDNTIISNFTAFIRSYRNTLCEINDVSVEVSEIKVWGNLNSFMTAKIVNSKFYNLKIFDVQNYDKVAASVTIENSFISALTHLGNRNFVSYVISNSQITSNFAGPLFPIKLDVAGLGNGKFEIINSEITHGNTTVDCGIKNDIFF